jgi:hypothetical protein
VCALVRGSPRDIWGAEGSKPLIFMRFHAVLFGNQHESWSKQHNGKASREYLTLLSICETCKYKGVSFLEFLRTGEKDIDTFIKKGARVSKEPGFLRRLPE